MNPLKIPKLSDPTAPLYWNAFLMCICLVFLIPLSFLDQRLVGGSLVWIKPIKFALSIGVYSLNLLWILQFFPKNENIYFRISWTITITSFIEIIAIFGQAARGELSHFNITTPLNGFIFSLMGFSIGVFWLAHLLLSFKLLKQKTIDPFLKETLLWGLLITAYGMIIGFFMTTPRPEQIELMKQGILIANGGHTFGAPDGGPGINFFGWSTIAGDLRVAHFFGMHALQVFSLIAIFYFGFDASKKRQDLSRFPLRILGIAIFGITLSMNIQALAGQSIFKTSGYFTYLYIFFLTLAVISFPFFLKPTKQIFSQQGR